MWGCKADLEYKIRVKLSFWTVAIPWASPGQHIWIITVHIPLPGSNVIFVQLNVGFSIAKKLPQVTLMCSQCREPWATESLCGKDRMWCELRSGWVYRRIPGIWPWGSKHVNIREKNTVRWRVPSTCAGVAPWPPGRELREKLACWKIQRSLLFTGIKANTPVGEHWLSKYSFVCVNCFSRCKKHDRYSLKQKEQNFLDIFHSFYSKLRA